MSIIQTKYDISGIFNSKSEISFESDGYLDVKYAGNKTTETNPINLRIQMKNVHEKLEIDLKLRFTFESECSRCLDVNNVKKEKSFFDDFNKNQSNDYDIDFASDEIEISSLISELILNEMKLQYICNNECKGLCSECGNNQNLAICKHPKKNLKESPFSSLTELDL